MLKSEIVEPEYRKLVETEGIADTSIFMDEERMVVEGRWKDNPCSLDMEISHVPPEFGL